MNSHSYQDQPSAWIKRFMPLIPADGEVLDLACGAGRHARALAASGHSVLAVDRDAEALKNVVANGITALQVELEHGNWPFAPNRFAAIVVTNYLHRPLFPHILNSLASQGILIYETFSQGNGRFGKPSNPDFLLMPGELLSLVQASCSMRVVAFEDGYVVMPKPAMVQRICAIKQISEVQSECLRLL